MNRSLISALALCLSFAVYAADKPQAASPVTKEQRESMAKVHEQMAACLRSDKSVDACHDEMKQSCKSNDACPMMKEHRGMHKGD